VAGTFAGEVAINIVAVGFCLGLPFFLSTGFILDHLTTVFEKLQAVLKVGLVLGTHGTICFFLEGVVSDTESALVGKSSGDFTLHLVGLG